MATRPIWSGTISFGLVSIPVSLFSGEQSERAHFHLLDKRNDARIHYERVNEVTGKKVPWEEVVKAYEFEKNNFVIVDEKQLENTNTKEFKTIEITEFVEKNSIEFPFLNKPYYLVPSKGGEKGYHLLLKILNDSKKAAISKMMIKTKQHLAAIVPYHHVLLLDMMRFLDEIRKPEEFYSDKVKNSSKATGRTAKKFASEVTAQEVKIANQLIESMTGKWDPEKYRNESNEILRKAITQKIKKGKSIVVAEKAEKPGQKASGKVVDFMELLKKSVKEREKKKKTSQKKTAHKK